MVKILTYIKFILLSIMMLVSNAKALDIIVGFPAGGGYDIYARALARHLDKHLPNEKVVVKNQPGAASLNLTNWLASTNQPVLAMINGSMIVNDLLQLPNTNYDATKLHWIASLNQEVLVCFVRTDTNITDIRQDSIIGATVQELNYINLLNQLAHTRIKPITGYAGTNEINLAVERNEVQGRCGVPWSAIKAARPQWIEQKQIRVLVKIATKNHPDLTDIPMLTDLIKDKNDLSIAQLVLIQQAAGRPLVASAATDLSTVRIWRAAVAKTVKDEEFLAEAKKLNIEVDYVSGEELTNIVHKTRLTDGKILSRAREYLK